MTDVRLCHWHAEHRCWGSDDILAEDYDGNTVWWACEGHVGCWDHEGNDRPILDPRRYDATKWRGDWRIGGGAGRWTATRRWVGGCEIELACPDLDALTRACADFDRRTGR